MTTEDFSNLSDGDLERRYTTALHAMQAGVSVSLNYDPKDTSPKHLRVGINSAMVNDAAVAELLIARGVFSKRQYLEALVRQAEIERDRYQELVRKWTGNDNISLMGML